MPGRECASADPMRASLPVRRWRRILAADVQPGRGVYLGGGGACVGMVVGRSAIAIRRKDLKESPDVLKNPARQPCRLCAPCMAAPPGPGLFRKPRALPLQPHHLVLR